MSKYLKDPFPPPNKADSTMNGLLAFVVTFGVLIGAWILFAKLLLSLE